MSDRPIIFSASMVRALLDGRKTQTRRLINTVVPEGQRVGPCHYSKTGWAFWKKFGECDACTCRDAAGINYWEGDRLYVRERCLEITGGAYRGVKYIADGHDSGDWDRANDGAQWDIKSRPSIHMPRWASRLTLTVTDVRVQRLQDIDRDDAMAEGIVQTWGDFMGDPPEWAINSINQHGDASGTHIYDNRTSVENYRELWAHLHGRESWDANPWIVAISFAVEHGNIDALPKKELAA